MKLQELNKPENKHGLKGSDLFREKRMDKDILEAMDEDTYEELIASWAYWCLKEKHNTYQDVLRLGGAGDGGMDVVAFYNQATRDCDIYQCKHYNAPINKSAIIAELGKFLYHVHTGLLPCPRAYYIMAPKGLSSNFAHIYTNKKVLKKTIISEWDSSIADHIEKKKSFKYEGDLATFLNEFDYAKFQFYSADRFLSDIHEKQNRHVYHQYFGVRKAELEKVKQDVPNEVTDYESKYIHHLIDAYNDVKKEGITMENVTSSSYGSHYGRSREEFWLAEGVRKMSEENCPGEDDEFAELANDMYHHVADTYEDEYENAYKRLKAVTNKSLSFPKKDRIISGELGAAELKGVCFQLSNEDKLIWKEK